MGVPTWLLVGAYGLRVILSARLTFLATQQQKIHHLFLIMSARICGIHTHIHVHAVFHSHTLIVKIQYSAKKFFEVPNVCKFF